MSGLDYRSELPGYFPSVWPVECGGPRRQKLTRAPGLGLRSGESLRSTIRDFKGWAVMLVQREPGELFIQGGGRLRSGEFPPHFRPGDEDGGWLERVDPDTLETRVRSPDLPSGGHLWCGAVVVHENGDLYVSNGRYCHRLNADCEILAERQLPVDGPYNGLLIMSDGNLVMKNLGHRQGEPCTFSVLEPERLEPTAEPLVIPQHMMGRFSSDRTQQGEFVYASTASQLLRLRYESGTLSLDPDWSASYEVEGADQADGWDTTIGAGSVWMMDMGRPPVWCGAAKGPQRAFRFPIDRPSERDVFEYFEGANPFSPGPPLYDPERGILVVYDGSNGGIAAVKCGAPGTQELLWRNDFLNNVQMMLYPDTGELIVEDASQSVTGKRASQAVALDIENGTELGRAPIGSIATMGMFACPGFGRDFYVASLPGAVARVFVD